MNKLKKNKKKVALITGITGQDGSYLAELLLREGYEVHGVIRRASTFNTNRIEHLFKDPHESRAKLLLHFGDITDTGSIITLLEKVHPDEIYNLAAQSHVRVSFDIPEYTVNSVGLGALLVLEAIRILDLKTKYYQASSSEMFGSSPAPQNEQTAFNPRSPYGIAKLMGHHMTVNYRESYNIFAVSGILFNHESPRRGLEFSTRKICHAVARIKLKKQKTLKLGNLKSKRDWGYAPEYVEAMWLMLQRSKPQDFVIGTGETHSVEEFAEAAFAVVGLDWRKYIEIDKKFLRPA